MSPADVAKKALLSFKHDIGKFYGSPAGMALGTGLIFDGIRFPAYDQEQKIFSTLEGPVLVLTHECDVDRANQRSFNELVIVCPIIKFDDWAEAQMELNGESGLLNTAHDLAAGNIFRVGFLPPMEILPLGGLLYLNQLSHTHAEVFGFSSAKVVASLSSYSMRILDYKLQNHLFRPKSDQLPRMT
jgi:hypothetical protein